MQYDTEYVKSVNEIACVARKIRFVLTVELKISSATDIENSVMVIMKNPSQANIKKSDKTINNVIREIFELKKYRKIYIMNLFPYYSTQASGLKKIIESKNAVYSLNNLIMKYYASKVDDVIFGWGTNTIANVAKIQEIYDAQIRDVVSIIKNLGKKMFYVHCCRCSNCGCGDSSTCKSRCKKSCTRTTNGSGKSSRCQCRVKRSCICTTNSKPCATVKYPMHLELWTAGKQLIEYT